MADPVRSPTGSRSRRLWATSGGALLLACAPLGASSRPCTEDDERAAVVGAALHFESLRDATAAGCFDTETGRALLDTLGDIILSNWKEPTGWGALGEIGVDVVRSGEAALLEMRAPAEGSAPEAACAMAATKAALHDSTSVEPWLACLPLRIHFLIPWHTDLRVSEEPLPIVERSTTSFSADDLKVGVEDLEE